MEKKTWLKLIVTIFVTVAIATGIYLRWRPAIRGSGPLAGWGTGNLKVSEKAYYRSKISRIIENWQQTTGAAERDKQGRLKESYNKYLVLDIAKRAIWLEARGQIQQDNHVEFPAGMKWKLYRVVPEGSTELQGLVRLKIRGIYSSRKLPEQFYLAGTSSSAGYISFNFGSSGRGSGSGSGRFVPKPYSSSRKQAEDSYGSLVVTDAEYEQYRSSLTAKDPNQAQVEEAGDGVKSAIAENLRSWAKVEKFLYAEIERQVTSAGFDLTGLEAKPGPDYSAAHAKISERTGGILRDIFGGSSYSQTYLKIDYLGDDIWYAKNAAPDPKYPARLMSRRNQLDLEFLLCPTGDIPGSQRTELLEKGRKIQQLFTSAELLKWKVTLPNGATAEFIGICEHPSAGKKWWAPDGSPLGYSPYFNAEPYYRSRDDRKIYEIAWEINWPQSAGGSGTHTSLEGCVGSYGRQIRDRYGKTLLNLSAGGYAFDKSRDKTTLKLGLKVGDQDHQFVTFKNISLVPGKDPGFKIELGE